MAAETPYSAASRRQVIAQRLAETGIIAHIRDAFSTQALTEIGDALLAAPVGAVVLAMAHSNADDTIDMLRRRGREFLLVGASEIESVADVEAAAAAGAQFVISPYLHEMAARRAAALDLLYIPGVLTTGEAILAQNCGLRLLCYAPADVLGLEHLADLRQAAPEAVFLAAGGIDADQVEIAVRAGAGGLIFDDVLIPGGRWTQAQIITAARTLQGLWETACADYEA
ncbi:MAG: hypothetical protein J5I90_02900 [Caldilineales bacterium]|nr:hypothetical protein [Caldilineales bacterium]